jgi:hypothetical protein
MTSGKLLTDYELKYIRKLKYPLNHIISLGADTSKVQLQAVREVREDEENTTQPYV